MARGHRQIEHTADLALEVWADDETELLREAALAVTAMLTEGATAQRNDAVTVRLETLDAGDRLVQWVNEVLYQALVKNFVLADVEVRLDDGGLVATLWGQSDGRDLLQTEIKSATYHDLEITRDAEGIRARLVMDV